MRLMGVDMGTSGCKAVVFDEKWSIVCDAYREYALSFPADGLLELDPNLVWENIKQVISEANAKSDEPVDALSISAIGDVILPLRYDGTPVRDAIIDFDPRGKEQIKKFVSDFGEGAFYDITGMPPLFIGSLAKILWIKENEPEIYTKVQIWGTFEDFIVRKLGRAASVSYSEAARTMLFDIREKAWSKQVMDRIPMDERMLPKAVPSGTKLGKVQAGLARRLGFDKAPEIVSGGHDMVCAAIGAGLDERSSDTAVNIAGTIEGIVVAMGQANTGAQMLDNSFPCYPGYDGYVTFSVNLTAGCILRWYRDVIARDTYEASKMSGQDVFQKLTQKLSANEPGDIIFLPHFSGSGNPHFDPNAKGTIYGLTLDSTRDDIVQAMIEGLCYELKLHSNAFAKAGISISAMRSVGGGAKIDRQLQLKANITGINIIKGNVTESSALGAAAMAGVAMGVIAHPSEAFAAVTRKEKRFVPQARTKADFEKAYELYTALFDRIHDFESQNN